MDPEGMMRVGPDFGGIDPRRPGTTKTDPDIPTLVG